MYIKLRALLNDWRITVSFLEVSVPLKPYLLFDLPWLRGIKNKGLWRLPAPLMGISICCSSASTILFRDLAEKPGLVIGELSKKISVSLMRWENQKSGSPNIR